MVFTTRGERLKFLVKQGAMAEMLNDKEGRQ